MDSLFYKTRERYIRFNKKKGKSMFRERIILWLLISLKLLAVILIVNQRTILGSAFLTAALFIAVVFVFTVSFRVKKFSKLHFSTTNSSLRNLLTLVETCLSQQRTETKQIIDVIEKIGTAENSKSIKLEGVMGEAMVHLQNKLVAAKEVEDQRVLAAQCITSLNEIRKDNETLSEYSYQITSRIVKFLGANQGAFYVLSDDETPGLELLSTYAYGKRKYASEKIMLELGTGLIGQCALEKEVMVLNDVPKDFIKISSGLGEALPRCIVIVPLLFREQVFGVLEIAAFQTFKPYQLEFLSKACETVGMELANIRTQEHTRKLLAQSREEELRQNLEEMKITQQQMLMKEEELSRQLITTQRAMAMAESERKKNEAILEGCMDAVVSFNEKGTVEYFNKAAEEIFGYSRNEIVGREVQKILMLQIMEDSKNRSMVIRTVEGHEVNIRTEINANDKTGEEISLLLTATKVKIDTHYLFTLFAQKVSVELF